VGDGAHGRGRAKGGQLLGVECVFTGPAAGVAGRIGDDASAGRMPGPWTRLRPETRLSSQDIDAICAAGRQAEAHEAEP
jgi:hypothetical protein